MRVSPNQILPSQNFLKPHTVQFIFDCIKRGELDQLPPDPIVRKNERGELIAIDGHNLIAIKAFLGEDIEVHLANSPEDGLPETSEANVARNHDLREKFESALIVSDDLRSQGIVSFRDLMSHYPDLFQQ